MDLEEAKEFADGYADGDEAKIVVQFLIAEVERLRDKFSDYVDEEAPFGIIANSEHRLMLVQDGDITKWDVIRETDNVRVSRLIIEWDEQALKEVGK